MDEFLRRVRSTLECVPQWSRVHVVVAGQDADVDPVAAALAYAYYLSQREPRDCLCVPVLNLQQPSVPPCTHTFLQQLCVCESSLLWRRDVNLLQLQEEERLSISLLGSDVLDRGEAASLAPSIVRVIHGWPRREGGRGGGGSLAVTVATEILQEAGERLSAPLAALLRDALLSQSVKDCLGDGHFPADYDELIRKLTKCCPEQVQADDISRSHPRGGELKHSPSLEQILLKERKELTDGDIKVTVSAVTINLEECSTCPNLLWDLKSFCDQHSYEALVLVSFSTEEMCRQYQQVAVYSTNKDLLNQICCELEEAPNSSLDMEPLDSTLCELQLYRLRNTHVIVEHVIMLVKDFLDRRQHPFVCNSRTSSTEGVAGSAPLSQGSSGITDMYSCDAEALSSLMSVHFPENPPEHNGPQQAFRDVAADLLSPDSGLATVRSSRSSKESSVFLSDDSPVAEVSGFFQNAGVSLPSVGVATVGETQRTPHRNSSENFDLFSFDPLQCNNTSPPAGGSSAACDNAGERTSSSLSEFGELSLIDFYTSDGQSMSEGSYVSGDGFPFPNANCCMNDGNDTVIPPTPMNSLVESSPVAEGLPKFFPEDIVEKIGLIGNKESVSSSELWDDFASDTKGSTSDDANLCSLTEAEHKNEESSEMFGDKDGEQKRTCWGQKGDDDLFPFGVSGAEAGDSNVKSPRLKSHYMSNMPKFNLNVCGANHRQISDLLNNIDDSGGNNNSCDPDMDSSTPIISAFIASGIQRADVGHLEESSRDLRGNDRKVCAGSYSDQINMDPETECEVSLEKDLEHTALNSQESSGKDEPERSHTCDPFLQMTSNETYENWNPNVPLSDMWSLAPTEGHITSDTGRTSGISPEEELQSFLHVNEKISRKSEMPTDDIGQCKDESSESEPLEGNQNISVVFNPESLNLWNMTIRDDSQSTLTTPDTADLSEVSDVGRRLLQGASLDSPSQQGPDSMNMWNTTIRDDLQSTVTSPDGRDKIIDAGMWETPTENQTQANDLKRETDEQRPELCSKYSSDLWHERSGSQSAAFMKLSEPSTWEEVKSETKGLPLREKEKTNESIILSGPNTVTDLSDLKERQEYISLEPSLWNICVSNQIVSSVSVNDNVDPEVPWQQNEVEEAPSKVFPVKTGCVEERNKISDRSLKEMSLGVQGAQSDKRSLQDRAAEKKRSYEINQDELNQAQGDAEMLPSDLFENSDEASETAVREIIYPEEKPLPLREANGDKEEDLHSSDGTQQGIRGLDGSWDSSDYENEAESLDTLSHHSPFVLLDGSAHPEGGTCQGLQREDNSLLSPMHPLQGGNIEDAEGSSKLWNDSSAHSLETAEEVLLFAQAEEQKHTLHNILEPIPDVLVTVSPLSWEAVSPDRRKVSPDLLQFGSCEDVRSNSDGDSSGLEMDYIIVSGRDTIRDGKSREADATFREGHAPELVIMNADHKKVPVQSAVLLQSSPNALDTDDVLLEDSDEGRPFPPEAHEWTVLDKRKDQACSPESSSGLSESSEGSSGGSVMETISPPANGATRQTNGPGEPTGNTANQLTAPTTAQPACCIQEECSAVRVSFTHTECAAELPARPSRGSSLVECLPDRDCRYEHPSSTAEGIADTEECDMLVTEMTPLGDVGMDVSYEEDTVSPNGAECRPVPPSSLDLQGVNPQRKKLAAPEINLSLDQSEGSILSDDALDTADELDINVDELDTPDEADSLEYTGHSWEETQASGQECSDAIPEYTTEEERQDTKLWRSVIIGEQEHRIDMKCIEPYQRVISHGGYYGDHNAIIVFAACFLPDSSKEDYQHVMENLFLYVISTLELMVAEDYMIVYLNGATPRRRMPGLGWLKKCYHMIDRRLRKNLKSFIIVHPSWFIRTILAVTRPFISSKFSSKIKYVNSLAELSELIPMEYVHIPESIIKCEEERGIKRYACMRLDEELKEAAEAATFNSFLNGPEPAAGQQHLDKNVNSESS